MNDIFSIKNKLLISLLTIFSACAVSAHEIQVFSITKIPISLDHRNVTVCNLDQVALLTREIKNDFKSRYTGQSHVNIDELKQRYTEKFKAMGNSMVCQFKAKQLGIQKLPAIVFDQNKVIYGVTDLDQAIAMYNQDKESSL